MPNGSERSESTHKVHAENLYIKKVLEWITVTPEPLKSEKGWKRSREKTRSEEVVGAILYDRRRLIWRIDTANHVQSILSG